ncbi:MAG: undecaprenyl-diphosphate phosphatase, partial [Myxococcota bacterium]|nr:undecaprenyl-diphosphate phosphatase [Myxococcota bacterium]
IEGLTEFVPVSSTGHLILASRALGLQGTGVDSFSIVIQLGALLAAVLYYRRLLVQMLAGLARSEPQAVRLFVSLMLASLPVLAVGYLLGSSIKAALFGPVPVAAALCVGGVAMILVDRWHRRQGDLVADLGSLSPRQVLLVGTTQVLSLWPGVSRSMSCILGGQVARLSSAAAADFAFLLAIPTLGTATIYDLVRNHQVILRDTGAAALVTGLVTSFVVGWAVIAALLRFLRRFGFAAFGYYRIAVGLLVLWFR